MKLISYAQNQEDIVLHRALRGVEKGFYIDVGAQHPIVDSVTKLFYMRGWSGINIDPVPQWFELLKSDRPHDINLRLAAGSATGRKKFYAIANTGLSTDDAELAEQHAEIGYRAEELDVQIRTLDDICDEYNVQAAHFLKIDVEGAEAEVIRGFAFDKVRPWIILVEAVAPVAMSEGSDMQVAVQTHAEWEPLLLAHGYRHVYSDGLNRFYLAEEHSELSETLSVPPNPLDAFIRNEEWIKHERILQLDEQLRQLTTAVQAVEQKHEIESFQGLVETAENRLRRIAELEQENARLTGAASTFERNIENVEGKLALLERNAALLEKNAAVYEREIAELQRQNDDLIGMRSERDRYFGLIQEMLHSRSWRITAPLRAISRTFTRSSGEARPLSGGVPAHARSLPRRIVRRILLFCLSVAQRHPRVHTNLRSIYSRIPGLRGRLSTFARNNVARADLSRSESRSLVNPQPSTTANGKLPLHAADVHRRLNTYINERHQRPE